MQRLFGNTFEFEVQFFVGLMIAGRIDKHELPFVGVYNAAHGVARCLRVRRHNRNLLIACGI